MPFFDSMPILYARDALGILRHVDEVENGEACGCTCPDPHCGQPLVAKNNPLNKRIHHFAHKRGSSCTWAAENVIVELAISFLRRRGMMAFPSLRYFDEERHCVVEASPARVLSISKAEAAELSGRGAPDIIVTCRGRSSEKRFAVLMPFAHAVDDGQVERLKGEVDGVVIVDLREDLRGRRRVLGKHYDRDALVAMYQNPVRIAGELLDEHSEIMEWAYSARRERLEAESHERWEAGRPERERKAAELAERARREREERDRLLAEEKARRDAAEREWEAELEARREAAHRKREEEEEVRLRVKRLMTPEEQARMRLDAISRIDQQDYPVKDDLDRRWVRCELCGEVKLADEFASYGGRGHINLGKCKDCMRESN